MLVMSTRTRLVMVRPITVNRKRQAGFTLVEVMVAALVLSVGLLGLAGLQAASLMNNQSAFMRSQASALAYDLADRMRTNVNSASANSYAVATAVNTSSCSNTNGCSPQQMAQADLAEWNTTIAAYLPLGQGVVCIDSTPNDGSGVGTPQCDGNGSEFAVKLWWDDDRDGIINVTATNVERFVISFRL